MFEMDEDSAYEYCSNKEFENDGFFSSFLATTGIVYAEITSFDDNENMVEVTVRDINTAFTHNNLTSVVIPDSVTTIGYNAFAYNNLTSVVIPDSVTTINPFAFANNNLRYVVIGENSNLTETTGIGEEAFFTRYNTTNTTDGIYDSNINLTTIYNNSGKTFKWYYVTQERNNSTDSQYNFVTGTVPGYTSVSFTYNEVTITTGYPE